MKALIDLCHPAHVHFFKEPITILRNRGHQVFLTSRHKDVTVELLDGIGFQHRPISRHRGKGFLRMAWELLARDWRLVVSTRKYRPDVMAAIGGTFAAHAGLLTDTPALVFYDTENARLQNRITYPFAARVFVPRCYQGWLPSRSTRYPGYHELSYLHPTRFAPDRSLAEANGLASQGRTFLVRVLAWEANHDVGETGWHPTLTVRVVKKLAAHGRVLISAEGALPEDLEVFRYQGNPQDLHHVMAYCSAYVGESATMASECAVLGVPAIYAAQTGRGYTDEQEARYGLVKNVRKLAWDHLTAAIDSALARPAEHWATARKHLLEDTVDVAHYVADAIERHPGVPGN